MRNITKPEIVISIRKQRKEMKLWGVDIGQATDRWISNIGQATDKWISNIGQATDRWISNVLN